MAAAAELKCIYVHIFWTKQGRNLNEMCFCMFSYMGNPMPYSVLSENVKKLLKTHIYCKNSRFQYTIMIRAGGNGEKNQNEKYFNQPILASNAAQHVMAGKGYARAIRTHKLTLQALWQLLLPQLYIPG